ncbi:uncharacterized protein LOC129598919 [Paramacrobiotus metropolitanus]|uniref:uncharacterized protein LOC129598919 n=1 Tax=Paramacrobiotus metropolitanus TaxID=2943436 RepID=UPI002445B406|nr:uncharacterized protein LOC129598919 [Paramacrobiotus metropolitanus]
MGCLGIAFWITAIAVVYGQYPPYSAGPAYPNPGQPPLYPGQNPGPVYHQCLPRPILTCGPDRNYYDPNILKGTWYIYRHLLTGVNGINRIYRTTILATTSMPGMTNIPAVAQRTAISWYPTSNDTTCSSMDFLGFIAWNGIQVVDVYQDVRPITTRTYCTVYLNQDQGLWILYRCEQPNLSTQSCDVPHVDVRVRQNPKDFPPGKAAQIDNLLNQLFGPFCILAEQIPLCEYTASKPDCPENPPTPDEQRKIDGMAATKA